MQMTSVSIWLCILSRIGKNALLYVESYGNVMKTIWKMAYKLSLGRRFFIQSEQGIFGQSWWGFFVEQDVIANLFRFPLKGGHVIFNNKK